MYRFTLIALIFFSCSESSDRNYSENVSSNEEIHSTDIPDDTTTTVQSDSYSVQKENDINSSLSAKLIYSDSLGWGYQIFDGSHLIINQVHIPAVQGNKGFKSREAAQITANFVLHKLMNNMRPAVSKKELDSLGVI